MNTAKLSQRVTSISSFYWYLSQEMTLSQFTFLFQFLCEAANNMITFCQALRSISVTNYNFHTFHKKLLNNLIVTEQHNRMPNTRATHKMNVNFHWGVSQMSNWLGCQYTVYIRHHLFDPIALFNETIWCFSWARESSNRKTHKRLSLHLTEICKVYLNAASKG